MSQDILDRQTSYSQLITDFRSLKTPNKPVVVVSRTTTAVTPALNKDDSRESLNVYKDFETQPIYQNMLTTSNFKSLMQRQQSLKAIESVENTQANFYSDAMRSRQALSNDISKISTSKINPMMSNTSNYWTAVTSSRKQLGENS